jgi:hypothetical protein
MFEVKDITVFILGAGASWPYSSRCHLRARKRVKSLVCDICR